MFTIYDEKAAYEQRYHSHSHPLRANPHTHTHSRHISNTSTSSTTSSSSYKYDSESPPPYAYIFYNSIGEKPLPPLPTSLESAWRDSEGERERRVRFVLEKPLPPLPIGEEECHGEGREREERRRPSSSAGERSARMGECAWWTKEVGDCGSSDGEGEELEKEMAMKGWLG